MSVIEPMKTALEELFPDAAIEYVYQDDLHKLRLRFENYTHWLYVTPETADDRGPEGLVAALEDHSITTRLQNAQRETRIMLMNSGVKECDPR